MVVTSQPPRTKLFPLSLLVLAGVVVFLLLVSILASVFSPPNGLPRVFSLAQAAVSPLPKSFSLLGEASRCDNWNCSNQAVLSSEGSALSNMGALREHLESRGWEMNQREVVINSPSLGGCRKFRSGFRLFRVQLGVGVFEQYLTRREFYNVSKTENLSRFQMSFDDLRPEQLILGLMTGEGICQQL